LRQVHSEYHENVEANRERFAKFDLVAINNFPFPDLANIQCVRRAFDLNDPKPAYFGVEDFWLTNLFATAREIRGSHGEWSRQAERSRNTLLLVASNGAGSAGRHSSVDLGENLENPVEGQGSKCHCRAQSNSYFKDALESCTLKNRALFVILLAKWKKLVFWFKILCSTVHRGRARIAIKRRTGSEADGYGLMLT
jgi:hypothetical protein